MIDKRPIDRLYCVGVGRLTYGRVGQGSKLTLTLRALKGV
jgi:hypothetical protein